MLKYVGPKPHISHTGIDFDHNKEDKYIYLHVAVELVKALSHDYFEDKKYFYTVTQVDFTPEVLMDELKSVCPNLDDLIKRENFDIEDEIEENMQRAHQNRVLTDEEKTILENNISIMHDYMVQRAINKSVYYCIVGVLAEQLKKHHIDYIIVPMFPKFLHVLRSAQGVLLKEKFPIDTKIDIYKEGERLLAKLQVINL